MQAVLIISRSKSAQLVTICFDWGQDGRAIDFLSRLEMRLPEDDPEDAR